MHDLLNADLLSSLIVAAQDAPRPVPEDHEVKAGYVALFLWLGMAVAVALLGWSLIRQFRKVSAARDAGLYGDPVVRSDADTTGDGDLPRDEQPQVDGASGSEDEPRR